MKKTLAILFSILLLCACIPLGAIPVAAESFQYDSLVYTIADGEASVTGRAWGVSGDIVIPDTVNGYPVTSIGNGAFSWLRSVTSVTIPDSVTTIKIGAFEDCFDLQSVVIGSGVTTIGDGAFRNCSKLTSVTIPSGVTTIGNNVFNSNKALQFIDVDDNNPCYCDVDGVLFTKDKTTLIQYPCGGSATTCVIPDSVTTVADGAFDVCDNLTSIDVGENNAYYCDVDGVLLDKAKTTLIRCPADSAVASFDIPDTVTTICEYAFYNCSKLTSVTIPSGVVSIGLATFYGCSSLEMVVIGDGVTTIGTRVFYGCSKLTTVILPAAIATIGYGAFEECRSLDYVYYSGTSEQRAEIEFDDENGAIKSATWHYNYHTHVYTNVCDADCDVCGAIREPIHVYSDTCDRDCNVCDALREPPHSYTHLYDEECDICGEWREVVIVYGDANGDGSVNARDAALLQQFVAGWDATLIEVSADVNGDGSVNARDVALLQQYVAGWNETLD